MYPPVTRVTVFGPPQCPFNGAAQHIATKPEQSERYPSGQCNTIWL
jgi:hypothetical protein